MSASAPDPRFREPACLFWGIGAQKAGTTWLHDYLSSHPDVKVPGLFKEQHYWNGVRAPHHDYCLPRTVPGRLYERLRLEVLSRVKSDPRTREWASRQRALASPRADHRDHASALLAGWSGEHAVGEITPAYALLDTATFAEMAGLSPDARFFYIMRDPVARAVSAARMYDRQQGDAGLTQAERLERALEGADSVLIDQSDYKRTIKALEAAVPGARIAYFFYETLFDQAEIDRLCAFLGVDPHPADTGKVVFSYKDDGPALPGALVARLEDRLAPTYDFVRARFAEQVPEAWRTL